MNLLIEVADTREKQLLKRGLEDEQTRAFVVSMGALLSLKYHRDQDRVLRFVESALFTWRRNAPRYQARKTKAGKRAGAPQGHPAVGDTRVDRGR